MEFDQPNFIVEPNSTLEFFIGWGPAHKKV